VQAQILPDGGHSEHVPGYHAACISMFLEPVLFCRINRWPFPREADRRIARMIEYAPYVTMPDRCIAHFGDGSQTNTEGHLVCMGNLAGVSMPWKGVSNSDTGLISNRPKVSKRKKTWPLAVSFPDVGYASARTGWDKDASGVVMHVSGFGGGHTHSDWLSFLYAWKGRTIITERGIQSYNTDHDNMLYRLGRAHNIVQIGERDAVVHEQNMWSKYVNAHAKLVDFKAGRKGAAEWTGEVKFLDGTSWTRTVRFFVSGKLVLDDKIQLNRGCEMEIRFHLDTVNAKMVSPVECVTADRGQPNIRISVEGPDGIEGTVEPVKLAPSFNDRREGRLLCFRPSGGRIKRSARFVTTIDGK